MDRYSSDNRRPCVEVGDVMSKPESQTAPAIRDAGLEDRLARVIAAAIWHPQPDMSGDIWQRVPSSQRRRAMDAARAVIEELFACGEMS
jgi:hypothetical protein